jgi:hypothetical protein
MRGWRRIGHNSPSCLLRSLLEAVGGIADRHPTFHLYAGHWPRRFLQPPADRRAAIGGLLVEEDLGPDGNGYGVDGARQQITLTVDVHAYAGEIGTHGGLEAPPHLGGRRRGPVRGLDPRRGVGCFPRYRVFLRRSREHGAALEGLVALDQPLDVAVAVGLLHS